MNASLGAVVSASPNSASLRVRYPASDVRTAVSTTLLRAL